MLFRKTLLVVFTCYACIAAAQVNTKQPDPTRQLVSKGRFYVGVSSQVSMGFAFPEGRFVGAPSLKPKLGYFIFDRWSIAGAYQLNGIGSNSANRFSVYQRGELELNYYFYAKKHLLMYAQAGVGFGKYRYQWPAPGNFNTWDYKLGTGISWNPKRTPNLSFTLEMNYHFLTKQPYAVRVYPELRIGISYSFGRKSHKAKTKPLTDL